MQFASKTYSQYEYNIKNKYYDMNVSFIAVDDQNVDDIPTELLFVTEAIIIYTSLENVSLQTVYVWDMTKKYKMSHFMLLERF